MTKQAIEKTVRDPRLDFFRGIAMFVIFIAHTPRDFWALWIPARFGFSDATETFVFCSGMASAIAFGAVFQKRGWLMGTARIAHRIWQVYWAHIGLFFAVLLLMLAFDNSGDLGPKADYLYVNSLNLQHFFSKTPDLVLGLFTLTYVPNYFDILPMYLVILAMIPIVMGLSNFSLWAVALFVGTTWLISNAAMLGATPINFPAEPWSQRVWFFNPLGWQLIFFTGFAFMRGWIKAPPVNKKLIWLAGFVVVVTIPFAWYRIYAAYSDWPLYSQATPWFKEQREAFGPLIGKTNFGLFRYIHFLATAYLAWVAVGPLGARLKNWGRGQFVVDTIRKVGQQSLAVFISSLVVAQFVGMIFKVYGDAWKAADVYWILIAMGNLFGFACLIAVAYSVSWFKSQPWRSAASVRSPISHSAGATTLPNGVPARKAD